VVLSIPLTREKFAAVGRLGLSEPGSGYGCDDAGVVRLADGAGLEKGRFGPTFAAGARGRPARIGLREPGLLVGAWRVWAGRRGQHISEALEVLGQVFGLELRQECRRG